MKILINLSFKIQNNRSKVIFMKYVYLLFNYNLVIGVYSNYLDAMTNKIKLYRKNNRENYYVEKHELNGLAKGKIVG